MPIFLLLLLAFGWFMIGGASITASIAIPNRRVWTIPLVFMFGAIPVVAAVLLLRTW